ncbi:MAG: Asp/Glu racemase [Pseudomonadota bacterium]
MTSYAYELLDDSDRRPTIGLVVLQTDETLEPDIHRYFPPSAADVYISRVPNAPDVTRETLADMANHIESSATLLPRSLSFDAVAYCCTSGSAVIGPNKVSALMNAGCRTAQVTDPVSALIHMCRKHDVKRLAFLSPYIESVSNILRDVMTEAGVETVAFGSFNEGEDAKVARIDPADTQRAAVELAKSTEVDAVFMSCTNLKTYDVLAEIEAEAGVPAFSSNSALAAHLGELAGAAVTRAS